MNKKPTTTKKNQTKSDKTPFYKRKWVIIVAIAAILFLSILVIAPRWYKSSQDKKQAQARINAIEGVERAVASVSDLPGESVDRSLKDAGCNTGNTKFGNRTVCNYFGKQVFKNGGNIIDGKRILDKRMVLIGYHRDTSVLAAYAFEELINSSNGTNLNYLNDVGQNIEIFAYDKNTSPEDAIISNLEDYNLKNGEYLYGIVVKRTYKISDSFILH